MEDDTYDAPSMEFAYALEGDRDAALEMWRTVARYPQDPESIAWVQEVAKRIVAIEDRKPDARRRPDLLQRAVGLEGRSGTHTRLSEFVRVMAGFDYVDEDGRPFEWKRGAFRLGLASLVREEAKRDLAELDREKRRFNDEDDEFLAKLADPERFTNDELQKLIGRFIPKKSG